jgi:hypothetical protein
MLGGKTNSPPSRREKKERRGLDWSMTVYSREKAAFRQIVAAAEQQV